MPPKKKSRELDLSAFPPGFITEYTTLVCLACIFDLFTGQMGLAPRTAYSEIKRYAPTIDELTAPTAIRPFFDSDDKHPHCPHCNAAKRWHARLDTYRIEGSKSTDAARRALVKSLPTKDGQFQFIEAKSDGRGVFFEWLDSQRSRLELDNHRWLIEAARAFLERSQPKINWTEVFADLRSVRKSKRIEEGWERDGPRLFLSPSIYDEVTIVQYLISRSHTHAGQTFEGRTTLVELIRRLRYSGYFKENEINEVDQFEILETLIENLSGGTARARVYYLVDRRDFLEKVKSVYSRYAS